MWSSYIWPPSSLVSNAQSCKMRTLSIWTRPWDENRPQITLFVSSDLHKCCDMFMHLYTSFQLERKGGWDLSEFSFSLSSDLFWPQDSILYLPNTYPRTCPRTCSLPHHQPTYPIRLSYLEFKSFDLDIPFPSAAWRWLAFLQLQIWSVNQRCTDLNVPNIVIALVHPNRGGQKSSPP